MNKIPKVIHYCWLSGDEMPQLIKDCIASWKEVLPDYEIILWDTKRFDVESVKWVKEACSVQAWAFAADYIRLYALYHYGGIYLDSDVRMLKSFDPYLQYRGFTGIEFNEKIFLMRSESKENSGVNLEFAIMGAEKGHPLIEEFMNCYHDRDFILNPQAAVYDTQPIPIMMTPIARKWGFNDHDYWSHQVLRDDFHVFPYDYFPGVALAYFHTFVSHNSVALHMHAVSWWGKRTLYRRLHSPFTEMRLHAGQFFRDIYSDVFRRKYHTEKGRKMKPVKKHYH